MSSIQDYPSVTVAIPVLNEEQHIQRVVEGFLSTGYPNLIEVLIADGGSNDKTKQIITTLSEKDNRVKMIDNPDRYQSYSLNQMIDIAKGEIFLRADAHCYYNEDYIEQCVSVMKKTGARNVGGAQRYRAKNRVQAGIALAVKSVLGNGGAKYMNENYQGYADTVFLGCFRTSDLREMGGFNTENITNQDSEFNLCLIEKYGSTVYVSPDIKSWYYPRDSFYKLFKQYFRYGRGRFLTRILHPNSSPIRGMIPFLSIFILSIYTVTDFVSQSQLFSIQVLSLFAILLLFESFRIVLNKRKGFSEEIWNSNSNQPGFISNMFSIIISIVLMHFGYFFGFSFQVIKSRFGVKKVW